MRGNNYTTAVDRAKVQRRDGRWRRRRIEFEYEKGVGPRDCKFVL